MFHLICATYTKTDNGLVLRNNFTQQVSGTDELSNVLKTFKMRTDFTYPHKNTISDILEGETALENVVIHMRIVRFDI